MVGGVDPGTVLQETRRSGVGFVNGLLQEITNEEVLGIISQRQAPCMSAFQSCDALLLKSSGWCSRRRPARRLIELKFMRRPAGH